jgi:hypothetical protein
MRRFIDRFGGAQGWSGTRAFSFGSFSFYVKENEPT